jgi:hypothetical protein
MTRLEVDRMKEELYYHYYHTRDGMWDSRVGVMPNNYFSPRPALAGNALKLVDCGTR